MKLKIDNCNDINFILYLINYIKKYIIRSINNNKLYYLNIYLASLLSANINCKNIIVLGANNLIYKKFDDVNYEIYINNNINLIGTNFKLFNICKMINYGTLSIRGYSIFTDAFNFVENNIDFLYLKYQRGL